MNVSLVEVPAPLWPVLVAVLALLGFLAATMLKRLPVAVGAVACVSSAAAAVACLFLVHGTTTLRADWSVAELRNQISSEDLPFTDAELEAARVDAYSSLAKHENLSSLWAEGQGLKETPFFWHELTVAPTTRGVVARFEVPLWRTLTQSHALATRSAFLSDLTHPQCQRNLTLMALRATGHEVREKDFVGPRCQRWEEVEREALFIAK